MKVSLSNLTHKHVTEYKLKKSVSNSFLKNDIETTVIYTGSDYEYLLNSTSIGDDKESGTIEVNCGGTTYTKAAILKHTEGKLDLNKCKFEKNITFENQLDCLLNNEINIFDYPVSETSTVVGDIQRESYFKTELIYVGEYTQELEDIYNINKMLSIVGTYPDKSAEGYVVETVQLNVLPEFNYETGLVNGSIQEYGVYLGHSVTLSVSYVRFYSLTSLGANWFPLIGGGFYYKFEIVNDWASPVEAPYSQLNQAGESPTYGTVTYLKGRYGVFSNTQISNTVKISAILEDIFSCTGKTLVSDFFGINPDDTAPQNPEYSFAESFCKNIKIAQSYDIIREAALEDSFGKSGLIRTKDFLTDLCLMYNLLIVSYDAEMKVRIEHVSYYSSKGIDLVGETYEIGEVDINRDLIDSESFTMAAKTPTLGFYEVIVRYRNLDIYKEPNEKRESAKIIITDVMGLINNKEYEKDEYKKLFFFLSCNESDDIIGLNTQFSIKSLFQALRQDNRPMKNGYIDGLLSTFGGFSIGMKAEIKFISNVVSWDKIQPMMCAKTEHGTFLINEVSIDEKGLITLNISK